MSVTNPVYSKNPFIAALQKFGHEVHEFFSETEAVVEKLPTVIKDVSEDTPGVTAAANALYVSAKNLVTATSPVVAAVEAGGANIPEDAAAVADEAAIVAAAKDLWAKVVAFEKVVVGDVKAIATDVSS